MSETPKQPEVGYPFMDVSRVRPYAHVDHIFADPHAQASLHRLPQSGLETFRFLRPLDPATADTTNLWATEEVRKHSKQAHVGFAPVFDYNILIASSDQPIDSITMQPSRDIDGAIYAFGELKQGELHIIAHTGPIQHVKQTEDWIREARSLGEDYTIRIYQTGFQRENDQILGQYVVLILKK